MKPKDFSSTRAGKVVRAQAGYWTFLPAPLPPAIAWSPALLASLSQADRALARLGSDLGTFANPHILVRPFVRREAVLSSRIEGTRASLEDLYTYEAAQLSFLEPDSDAREVLNYVRALEFGLERLRELPVSLRLIRELHAILMAGVRGEQLTPGEFRRSPVWIGPPGSVLENAPFVPPPVAEMHAALDRMEKYIHALSQLPPLARLGLIHYQFEAIHPFLDGNGRLGRLLIVLLAHEWKLLSQPWLYLSAYFEAHRQAYYDRLLAVSQRGAWEGWLAFFLEGVRRQSQESLALIRRLEELRARYRQVLQTERNAERLEQVLDFLLGQPVVTVRQVQEGIEASDYKIAQRYVIKFEQLGILREVTGRARNRIYRADAILQAIQTPPAPEEEGI